MRTIEAYHCDYCKKYSKSKGVITRHEKECYHNPATKACATCAHFGQEEHKRPDFFIGQSATHLRPVCDLGIGLYIEDEERVLGYKAALRNHCEAWSEREVEES